MKDTMIVYRQTLGWLGLLLPIIDGCFALLAGHSFIPSISSTHYMNTYLVFEGMMMCIGLFLITYKGYDFVDDVLTTVGGIGAIVTGLMPCSPPEGTSGALMNRNFLSIPHSITNILHLVFVALFFISISLLVLFQFTKGDKTNPQKQKRNIIYYVCGGVMLLGLIALVISGFLPFEWHPFGKTFIFEWVAIWAFAVAWITKGNALKTFADK